MNYANDQPHPLESGPSKGLCQNLIRLIWWSPLLGSPETAFWVTGLTEGTVDYEHHLRALLGLTPLRTIQWVNLARRRVQLASLNK